MAHALSRVEMLGEEVAAELLTHGTVEAVEVAGQVVTKALVAHGTA